MRALVLRIILVLFVVDGAVAVAANPAPGPSQPPSQAAKPSGTESPGILVPGGTTVQVTLLEPVSSSTANEGDQLAVKVAKEVDIGGFLIIPAGSAGHATVAKVDRAGSNGHGGQLGITIDWVYSQDGGKIKLSPTNHASDSGQQTGAASTATILSYVLLGPVGLFAHNFVRGRDVTVDTKQLFSVFIDHDIHVVTTAKATNPGDGFDK